MRYRRSRGDSWVDVYREGIFGGRVQRLRPGECARFDKVGSIIVGPGATVSVVSDRDDEILTLPPRKLVTDVAKLLLNGHVCYLRVSRAIN